jgi:hypothetical protein
MAVDQLVGQRGRSRFFAEAVEEKLVRVRLLQAVRKVAGSLEVVDIPGWESAETAAEWVRALRRALRTPNAYRFVCAMRPAAAQ